MKNCKIVLLSMLLTVLISACATMPGFKNFHTLTPPRSIEPMTGKSVVYFTRPDRHVGQSVLYYIYDNGERIGGVKSPSWFYVYISPGRHVFTAGTEAETKLLLDAEEGREYFIRCGVEWGVIMGRPTMELTTRDNSMAVIATAPMVEMIN